MFAPPALLTLAVASIGLGSVPPSRAEFAPVTNPPVPAVAERTGWPQRELDRFVLENLQKAGLEPSAAAEPGTLLRRVFLDLTGLPPTHEEVAAFRKDPSLPQYAATVDRLLAAPSFGERWASVWLDLARYADTQGYEKDNFRTIWSYRDWVIQAFNDDMPFDQFTIEQLAGDLLPHPTTRQLVATAFHRNTMTNTEGGVSSEEFRIKAVIDRVNVTWEAWMGMNFACAQCHDHPEEPITQRDYFAFQSFFNNTEDANEGDDRPTLTLRPLAEEARVTALEAERSRHEIAGEKSRMAQCQQQLDGIPETTVPIMRELPLGKVRKTTVFRRGNWLEPGEEIEAATPAAFPPLLSGAPRNRLGLAQWIASADNPRTSRVIVSRLWAQLFGRPLEPPAGAAKADGAGEHMKLLDHLAYRFSHELGWSVKQLLREIALSATYQQSSSVRADLKSRDPENRLFARAGRFRLPAETLRDQALAVSGLLSRKMYGRSVMPPQPDGVWQVVYNVQRWTPARGEDRNRRSLYTFWRRTSPFPALATLGIPSRENCAPQRDASTTPLGALALLNDETMTEAAKALGDRMARECADRNLDEQLSYGYELLMCVPPSGATLDALRRLHRATSEMTGSAGTAYTTVASALLNLEATCTHE